MNTDHGGPDARGVPRWDFSTNANACGPCPTALAALQQADARHYPDPAYAVLREQLAAFHGVATERIVLAASASEFIARLTAALRLAGAQRVWLPRLAYGDYARAATAWGLARVSDPAQADLLWLCEPSSPLGGAEPLAADVTQQGGVVVLDRAYEPLRLTGTCSLGEAALQRVWQLWSPNKALGLTGVRGAYAIAPLPDSPWQVAQGAALVMSLAALAPSWPLGAHGVALLQAWVQPDAQAWLADSRKQLAMWKAAQIDRLQALGWRCLSSDAPFFCAQPAAPLDAEALRRAGVKLRDTRSLGLPDHWRLSVQPPQAQTALFHALDAQQEVFR